VWGGTYGGEYFAGYITEKSLSVDNLFVFVLIIFDLVLVIFDLVIIVVFDLLIVFDLVLIVFDLVVIVALFSIACSTGQPEFVD